MGKKSTVVIRLDDWRVVATLCGLFITFFGVVGVIARVDQDLLFRMFDLDFENNFPTLYSASLLFANAWLVYRLKREGEFGSLGLWLAVVFLFMSVDEVFRVHERSERVTGIDYQLLLLPLIALAGAGWFHVLYKLRKNFITAIMWIVGAAAWGSSQLLEAAEWGWWVGDDEPAKQYVLMMITEELLEMSGSALFFLSLLRFRGSLRTEQEAIEE